MRSTGSLPDRDHHGSSNKSLTRQSAICLLACMNYMQGSQLLKHVHTESRRMCASFLFFRGPSGCSSEHEQPNVAPESFPRASLIFSEFLCCCGGKGLIASLVHSWFRWGGRKCVSLWWGFLLIWLMGIIIHENFSNILVSMVLIVFIQNLVRTLRRGSERKQLIWEVQSTEMRSKGSKTGRVVIQLAAALGGWSLIPQRNSGKCYRTWASEISHWKEQEAKVFISQVPLAEAASGGCSFWVLPAFQDIGKSPPGQRGSW